MWNFRPVGAVVVIVAASLLFASPLHAQGTIGGGGGPGGSGGGTPNKTNSAAGPATSLAIDVTSLTLTAAQAQAALKQCWNTSTGAPIAITSYSLTGSPVTSITLNFSSSSNITCGVNSSGATGPAGAQGTTGATGPGYTATSTTSTTIGTGSKTFTTQAGLAYSVGARVRYSSAATPTNFMEGMVTAYSSTSMTVNVDKTGGAGTAADWNINLAGEVGAQGAAGSNGAAGSTGPAGPGYLATSTTSLTISTGSRTFTTQAGLAYSTGARVRASSAANTNNYMEGVVSSYSGTTLIVTVDTVGGSGTQADWNINVAGNVGAQGPAGANGANGANGTNGTNGAISQLQTNATPLTVRPTLNFGANMTCTDNAGANRTDCNPSASATVNPDALTSAAYCPATTASGTAYGCATGNTSMLATGQFFWFKVDTTNTGNATISVNSSAATPFRHKDGSEMDAGDLVANDIWLIYYNGAVFVPGQEQLSNNPGRLTLKCGTAPANPSVGYVRGFCPSGEIPNWLDSSGNTYQAVIISTVMTKTIEQSGSVLALTITSSGTDTFVATMSPTLTALTDQMVVTFRPNFACSGPATLNIDAFGAKSIFAADGISDPACLSGAPYRLTYNAALASGAGAWQMPSGGGSGTGDVVGPASATDSHLACFNGTTGKLIKDCTALPTGATTPNVSSGDSSSKVANTLYVDSKIRYLNSQLQIEGLNAGDFGGLNYFNGAGLTAGTVYYMAASGSLTAASASATSSLPANCIAISTNHCLFSGIYRFSSSQGWTPGQLYVADSAGTLSATPGTHNQPFGIALANDTILVKPGPVDAGTGSFSGTWADCSVANTFANAIGTTGDLSCDYERLLTNAQTGTSYTILTTDHSKTITFNNASAVAVTLPQANGTTFKDGFFFFAKNTGAGLVTITPTTSTIAGLSSISLDTGEWALIKSDSTNYQALGSQRFGAQAGPAQCPQISDPSAPTTPSMTYLYCDTSGRLASIANGGSKVPYAIGDSAGAATAIANGIVTNAKIGANAVDSSKLAVVNTRRVCDIAVGDTSGSALTNAQLGPQKRVCFIPAAATVVEINVAADGGTPNVIVGKNSAGTVTNLLSAALATAASGGIACAKTSAVACIDGVTTASATLQNTSLAAGDYLGLVSGTAGGTAKFMTIHIVYTVN